MSKINLINRYFSILFVASISFFVSANEDRHTNTPPPATNPQNPQSQMNNQNPSSVNQQMLREQNARIVRNQQGKENLSGPQKAKPESSSDYVSPLEHRQR
jgi:hypothetical protein